MNISFCQIETDDSMDSIKGWKRCKHKKYMLPKKLTMYKIQVFYKYTEQHYSYTDILKDMII